MEKQLILGPEHLVVPESKEVLRRKGRMCPKNTGANAGIAEQQNKGHEIRARCTKAISMGSH